MARVRSHTTNPAKVKHLPGSVVEITLHSDDTFSATFSSLADHVPDLTKRVSIAVGAGSTSSTFDLGTVAAPYAREPLSLEGLDKEKPRVWRLLVWDESTRRIVASNERLQARDQNVPAGREPLLPVRSVPLGSLVWKLALHEGSPPELLVNSSIPGLKKRLNTRPELRGAIVPEAARQCLMHVLANSEIDDDDEGAWQRKWLRFADRYATRPEEWPACQPEQAREWADAVVNGLAAEHGFAKALASLWSDADVDQ